ncbi:MAG TPA: DMT family transporter [Candidatus Limnocylindrales bacterium]
MTRRALVLFGLMSLVWGIPYLFIRIAVAEIPPAVLVFARTGLAAVILLPVALLRTDLRPVLARWRWLLAFAAAEIAVPWILLASAEQQLTSSLAGLLVAGVPLVGTVIAVATRARHHVSGRNGLGLLVGLVGVAAIVGVDLQVSNALAIGEVGLVVVGYAIGPAILARPLAGLPSLGVMALSLSASALVYAPIAALERPASVPSAGAVLAVVILAVVCTAVAFLLFAALIEAIGPVRSTVITYVNPAVAALLGVGVLHEPLTVGMAVGFGLVIAGSVLATASPTSGPATASVASGAAATEQPAGLDEAELAAALAAEHGVPVAIERRPPVVDESRA